ncbi:F-box protein PP2-B15-like [Actinidia eriantha]|uniref:F-box protein PP2-B15-like n=1 Tax=Actinidia eriantha TaxID=165200 RepID=UPI0025894614|nr:F-box protein PP2-B15-like [Actinidia eriantha]
MDFSLLPEDCVSKIISLTSPLDACRSSLVSAAFRSAADSNEVWERFLPSDYRDLVSRSKAPNLKFCSMKELYFRLCEPTLIDGGNKSFKLDKLSGKKCYVQSARELSITWSSEPMYWIWKPVLESRFSKVAVLRTIWWLEIQGKIRTKTLSTNTTYGAYLIMKISQSAYGLDSKPLETQVKVGNNHGSTNTTHLRLPNTEKQHTDDPFYTDEGDGRVPRERDDGWAEIELGEFFSGDGDEEVEMSLREVKGYQLKGGLVVEGIEIRPKHQ